SRGRKCQKRVAGLDVFSGEQTFPLNRADDESREIIFAGLVETWHLGGFSANQGATRFAASPAHSVHELLDDVRIHFPKSEIVQKKQWLCTLHQNVVHAMIDKVAADGRVNVHSHGDFEFCADTIGARNKNWLFELFRVERKKRAEAADAPENSVGESA